MACHLQVSTESRDHSRLIGSHRGQRDVGGESLELSVMDSV